MLRRLAFILPLVLGSAFVAGCDSNDSEDEEVTDADRIVGTWDATSANVDGEIDGPVGPIAASLPLDLDGEGGIELQFTAGGDYSLTTEGPLNAEVPFLGPQQVLPAGPPVTIAGTYVLDEDAGEIAFTGDQTGAVTFDVPYTFSGADELRFVLESGDLIVALLADAGADPELAELVRGGSMTLTRR